jgi:hypothetical protein
LDRRSRPRRPRATHIADLIARIDLITYLYALGVGVQNLMHIAVRIPDANHPVVAADVCNRAANRRMDRGILQIDACLAALIIEVHAAMGTVATRLAVIARNMGIVAIVRWQYDVHRIFKGHSRSPCRMSDHGEGAKAPT